MSPPLGGLFHARGIGVNGSTWLRQRQPTANAILPEAERRPDMKKIFRLPIRSHRKCEVPLSALFDYVFWKSKIASLENIAAAVNNRDLQASSARQSPETTCNVV